jgi:hypothetical protein
MSAVAGKFQLCTAVRRRFIHTSCCKNHVSAKQFQKTTCTASYEWMMRYRFDRDQLKDD